MKLDYGKVSEVLYDVVFSQLNIRYINTAKTELNVRCPYCGDSIKSAKSAHFYIEINFPFRCYCQRCETKKLLNNEVLKDLKLYDKELNMLIYSVSSNRQYDMMNSGGSTTNIFKMPNRILEIPEYSETELNLSKLDYINDRLGTDINIYDCPKYKIVASFKEFAIHNEITKFTVDKATLILIEKYCVGFLSFDSSYIVFRNITDKDIGFRYKIYNVFDSYDNTKKFYSIPNQIDLLSPKLKVVMTEGIFDLLSVHNNFYKDNTENTIFISVNGKGYIGILKHLIKHGFLNLDIHIYSDKDVNLNFYKKMKINNIIIQRSQMTVYYNSLSKDYGILPENINLISSKI